MNHAVFTVILLFPALLSGCGQTGPLYLPEQEALEVPAEETNPDQAEKTEAEEVNTAPLK
jgi:predicted small lipoprotein YifL